MTTSAPSLITHPAWIALAAHAQQVRDVSRIVLPVAIDLHGHVVVVLERVEIAGLHRATDAEVERETQHGRARGRRARAGAVRRAIVDHEHVEVGGPLADLLDRACDRRALVVRGYDREMAVHVGEGA